MVSRDALVERGPENAVDTYFANVADDNSRIYDHFTDGTTKQNF